jgi:glutaredoxin 3
MPKKVIIYTTSYCPYCTAAKNLLKQKKVSFQEVDITNDEKKREELEKKTGWMTVPMIFIGDEFVGGSSELHALDAEGKLDAKLK